MWKYLALRKFGAVFAETLLLVWCVLGAYIVRLHESPFSPTATERHQILPKALLIAVIFQLFLHLNDIYDFRHIRASKVYLIRLFQALVMATASLWILYYIAPTLMIGRGVFGISLIFSTVFLIFWHTMLRMYFGKRTPKTKMLVLGTGNLAREAVREILRRPELGIQVLGFVDDNPKLVGQSIVNPKVIGTYQDLPKLVAQGGVDRIIVGLPDRRGKLPIQELLDFK
ncbi:MAG: hypothetical protein JXR49_14720, partial [Acidobacteria bacterium]|nr:hypothetical protein [Acidobacteriota bacterium]